MFKEGIAKFLKLDSLMENLSGYVEARIELMKYEIKDDLAKVLSRVSVIAVLVVTGMFSLLFLSISVAVVIGHKIGYFAGFGIVSLVYLIAGIVLLSNREALQDTVEGKIKDVIKQKKK